MFQFKWAKSPLFGFTLLILVIFVVSAGCTGGGGGTQPTTVATTTTPTLPITTPPTVAPTSTVTPPPTPSFTQTNTGVNTKEIVISSPKEQGTVGYRATVSGTSAGVDGQTVKLFVLIRPDGYSWWVQDPVTLGSDGSWSVDAYFGERDKDIGRKFQISVVATSETLKTGELLVPFPTTISRKDITVTRN